MCDGNHTVEVADELIQRVRFSFQGAPLSEHDTLLMRIAFRAQSALLLDFLPSDKAWCRWCSFLGRGVVDIQALSDTLKYGDAVLKLYCSHYTDNPLYGDAEECPRDVPSFKRSVRDRRLDWGFLSPFEETWQAWFACPAYPVFRTLNQWVNLLTHVTLRDIDLQTTLIEEYEALEVDEDSWDYDALVLADLNRIMRSWLRDLRFVNPVPCHGPGAVAGMTRSQSRLDKYAAMFSDARLSYYTKRAYDDIAGVLPPGGFNETSVLDRTSELVCVPKSMSKNRTISKEPCSLMYFQHGAQRTLDEYFQEHPILKDRIDLHHQERSASLAQRGSIAGEWDTIDLSSASDSVTVSLIKRLFVGTSYLIPAICLRSDRTKLPNGKIIRLNKYAPMGSDLCFPSMCLVFASICELAVRNTSGRTSRTNDFLVYGDDIVVKREFTCEVNRLLALLHFQVNSRKTFCNRGLHNFREACGGEYMDGSDVTPLRISRRLHLNHDAEEFSLSSVEAVSSVVEFANSCFERGYTRVRSVMLALLKEKCSFYGKLPYTSEVVGSSTKYGRSTYVLPTYSVAILTYSWCCTNFRVRSRYSGHGGCAGLFGMEYYLHVPKASSPSLLKPYRKEWTSDDVRYFEYWLTLPDRPERVDLGVMIAPEPISGLFSARPVWRDKWVLAYA